VAGSPLITPSLIIGSLRYGETSRIVRLATRDHGVLSAIAKGALRPRSRFGASLQLMSEGQAHLIPSRTSDLHTLTAFDLTALHGGLAADLERFAAASALAELATRFVPPAPSPDLYHQLLASVALLELAPSDATVVVGLRALWRMITELGVAPVMRTCARDGAALPEGAVAFSFRDGGFLCASCAVGGASTRLGPEDRDALLSLIEPGEDLPVLSPSQVAAHRRLLVRWVQSHLGETPMPALEYWLRGGMS
jgi:DNA repair protein RecO (recombination protein O)